MQERMFGEILQNKRKKRGISQAKLAEITGFTTRAISLWETGKRGITIASADKVAKALGFASVIGSNDIFIEFTYEELTRLNEMISVALLTGKIEFDDISKEVHRKVTNEIKKRNDTTNMYGCQ